MTTYRRVMNPDRVLFIAERVHDPELRFEEVQSAEYAWSNSPLACMLTNPGMMLGNTRQRLHDFLRSPYKSEGLRVMNLLPPSVEMGAWNPVQAKANAKLLHSVFDVPPQWNPDCFTSGVLGITHPAYVVLLGRKVADAFGWTRELASLGCSSYLGYVPAILMPHPSGRSRVWNDLHKVEELRRKFWEFSMGYTE